jgi:hypothetical protein
LDELLQTSLLPNVSEITSSQLLPLSIIIYPLLALPHFTPTFHTARFFPVENSVRKASVADSQARSISKQKKPDNHPIFLFFYSTLGKPQVEKV